MARACLVSGHTAALVALGMVSLEGTKLAGNAAQKADKTLPQIDKLLAEASAADAADDARPDGNVQPATRRRLHCPVPYHRPDPT